MTIPRNYAIDSLKMLCAVLVVMIHAGCASTDPIRPLTRCAVPCFFMISGYLLFNGQSVGTARLQRNIRHVLKITALATLFYVAAIEALAIYDGAPFVPTRSEWLSFILFNRAPFGFHLWYLWAYLYVLLIVWVVDKFGLWRWLFAAVPFLLVVNLLAGEWSPLIFGHRLPNSYVRNFLFTGLPFFALGAWLKTKSGRWNDINRRLLAGGGNFVFINFTDRTNGLAAHGNQYLT